MSWSTMLISLTVEHVTSRVWGPVGLRLNTSTQTYSSFSDSETSDDDVRGKKDEKKKKKRGGKKK